MTTTQEALRLAQWCDENSSGAYRQSAEAAAALRSLASQLEQAQSAHAVAVELATTCSALR